MIKKCRKEHSSMKYTPFLRRAAVVTPDGGAEIWVGVDAAWLLYLSCERNAGVTRQQCWGQADDRAAHH